MTKEANTTMRVQAVRSTDDVEQARRLFLEYGERMRFQLCFDQFEQELQGLPDPYQPPTGELVLARLGERAGGTAALCRVDDDLCEMKRLFVQPRHRGRGIGRSLVQALVHVAGSRGYRFMRLDTSPELMADAIRLYRNLGFEPAAETDTESLVVGTVRYRMFLAATKRH